MSNLYNCNTCKSENELNRLKDLYEYEILDTQNEESLDSITSLAQSIFETPICLISLLDENRQWFKSNQGLKCSSTPKKDSFCQFAIKQDEIFEVENASEDERFKNTELVTGYPFIKYYCGFPLKTPNGYNIGTLCVIDVKPSKKNDYQKFALKTLAKQIINQFELKKLYKQLKISNNKLIDISIERNDFLSTLSHEIRTPLNAINGFTNISEKYISNEKQKEYLSITKFGIKTLTEIINKIFDFSDFDSKKKSLVKKPFCLKSLLSQSIMLFNNFANEKKLKISFDIEDNTPLKFIGDQVRLKQILINLIGNALKFTSEGSIHLGVKSINLENPDEDLYLPCNLQFSIKDTGIGIEEKNLNLIFNKFEQTSSEIAEKYGGTGLGLNIVKNLIEIQNGTIEVKSIYGKGSEFIFNIVYEIDDENNFEEKSFLSEGHEPEEYKQMEKNEEEKNKNFEGNSDNDNDKIINILLVEDTSFNVRLIQSILGDLNYYDYINLTVVNNGKVGFQTIRDHPSKYDIILMDLQMPIMDGFQATKLIRKKLKSDIPIIALTANLTDIERDQCLKIGMNDFFSKPFNKEALFKSMRNFLKEKINNLNINDEKNKLEKEHRRKSYLENRNKINSSNNNDSTNYNNNSTNNIYYLFNNNNNLKFYNCIRDIDIFEKDYPFNNKLKGFNQESRLNLIKKTQKISITEGKDIVNNINTENINYIENEKQSKNQNDTNSKGDIDNLLKEISINFDAINEMTDGDEEMKQTIIDSFLEEFPNLLTEFENTLKKKDIKNVGKICHKMKSPIRLFGMNKLLEDIIFIEKYAKDVDKNLVKISSNFESFIELITSLYISLKNLKLKHNIIE